MDKFESLYSKLNAVQKAAVDHIDGPLMVVAGPGTGKTQMIALRIANILRKTDVEADSILCLTFTEAGVKAMRERLIQIIGKDAYKISINTFHGFANEVIQTFPDKFAFAKELKSLDDLTKVKLLRNVIDKLSGGENLKKIDKLAPFHNKYQYISTIISSLQNLKKENIDPSRFESKVINLLSEHRENIEINKKTGRPKTDWTKRLEDLEKSLEFAEIYKSYQEELRLGGFYDYEDMIMFVISEFEKNSEMLAYYYETYLYILVDEYQDTNGAQNDIVSLLGSYDKSPNIFVVGDDDQAIYRFQGANLGNIIFFDKNFSNVKKIATDTNYRSTTKILAASEALIENNSLRLVNEYKDIVKKLRSVQTNPGENIVIREFINHLNENTFVINKIKELIADGVKPSEIAVIFRKNDNEDDIAELLSKEGIKYSSKKSGNIFSDYAVNSLLKILKVVKVYDKNIDELLYSAMLLEFNNIDLLDIYKIVNYSSKKRLSLFETLFGENITEVEISENIKVFIAKIKRWHLDSNNLKFVNFIENVINESGLLSYLEDNNLFDSLLSLNVFFDFIKNQNKITSFINLESFLDDISLMQETGLQLSVKAPNSGESKVQLLTAHSSKGLEFEYIFIIKATSNNFGKTTKQSSFIPAEIISDLDLKLDEKTLSMEDERRLFYVALTRAKTQVFITYAQNYEQNGATTNALPSLFISELPKNLTDFESVTENLNSETLTLNLKSVKKDYSESEKEFLLTEVANLKLSPTTLNEYLASPLEFKFKRLIRVPTAINKSLALGIAIHYALEKSNRMLMEEQRPNLNLVVSYFEKKLTDEFEGDLDFEQTKNEGIKMLEQIFSDNLLMGTNKTLETEYDFGFHNVYLNPESEDAIRLTGKIDKVELLDKETLSVKVIDYKTGSYKTENEVLGKTKNSNGDIFRQLVFYKLLGDLDIRFKPKNSLDRYNITHSEVIFLKPEKGVIKSHSFEITQKDLAGLKQLISEVMKKIRNLEFPEKTDIDFKSYLGN